MKGIPVAVLDYHDFKILIFIDFVTLYQVLIVAGHHDLRLSTAKALQDLLKTRVYLLIYLAQIKDFHSHNTLGLFIYSPVNCAIVAVSQQLINDIVSNLAVGNRIPVHSIFLVAVVQKVMIPCWLHNIIISMQDALIFFINIRMDSRTQLCSPAKAREVELFGSF